MRSVLTSVICFLVLGFQLAFAQPEVQESPYSDPLIERMHTFLLDHEAGLLSGAASDANIIRELDDIIDGLAERNWVRLPPTGTTFKVLSSLRETFRRLAGAQVQFVEREVADADQDSIPDNSAFLGHFASFQLMEIINRLPGSTRPLDVSEAQASSSKRLFVRNRLETPALVDFIGRAQSSATKVVRSRVLLATISNSGWSKVVAMEDLNRRVRARAIDPEILAGILSNLSPGDAINVMTSALNSYSRRDIAKLIPFVFQLKDDVELKEKVLRSIYDRDHALRAVPPEERQGIAYFAGETAPVSDGIILEALRQGIQDSGVREQELYGLYGDLEWDASHDINLAVNTRHRILTTLIELMDRDWKFQTDIIPLMGDEYPWSLGQTIIELVKEPRGLGPEMIERLFAGYFSRLGAHDLGRLVRSDQDFFESDEFAHLLTKTRPTFKDPMTQIALTPFVIGKLKGTKMNPSLVAACARFPFCSALSELPELDTLRSIVSADLLLQGKAPSRWNEVTEEGATQIIETAQNACRAMVSAATGL